MKRILLLSICFCIAALQAVLAQDAALTFRDARELTITGKVFPQTGHTDCRSDSRRS